MSSIRKQHPNRRVNSQYTQVERPQPVAPLRITEATASGTLLTLSLSQAVALKGLPKIATDVAGAQPVSAQQVNPNTVAITFSQSIDAATKLTIDHQDFSIRNWSGGFVADSTFPLAA